MTCIQLMMIINQLLLQDFFCLWTCIGRSYKSYRGYSSTSCSWWWVQMSSVLIPTWGHSGCWNSTVHNVSHICHMLVNSIHYPQPPPPPPILNSSGYFGFFWCNPFFCWDSIAILGFFWCNSFFCWESGYFGFFGLILFGKMLAVVFA